jgi:hypothetical protein
MTLGTAKLGMCPCELKACGCGVIKAFVPSIHAVAGFAPGRKPCSLMIHGLGTAVIFNMAAGAIRTQAAKNAYGRALMAILALQRGMSAEQRESVLMSVHIPDDLPPASRAVALFAIAPEFTAMNVRVTGCALFPHCGKNQ